MRQVCVSHLREEDFALPPEDRHLVVGDQPDHQVVGVPVLVGELVAEVHDAPSVGEAREEGWSRSREGGGRLPDGYELPLDG